MIKVKDGYAKLIGTTYSGSADRVLLSNGGDKAVSDFAAASALSDYVTLATAQNITGAKTFYSTIYIKSGNSITDEGGNGVLGVKSTIWTGIPSDGTAISLGTLNNSLYFRSSGDNMYHYRNDKGTSYKVLDTFNYNYYSPTLTGGGASGTWGISITGSAATASTANMVSHSTYYYDGNVMTNSTSSDTIFGKNAKANYLFPSFMQSHPLWSNWADVLNFTGYCKWGGTQIATEYNAIKPRIAIRKFNQSRADWGDWTEFITSGNLTYQVGDWNSAVLSIFKSSENGTSNAPTKDFCYGVHLRFHRNTTNYFTDLVTTLYSDNLYYRRHTENGYSSWKKLAFISDIPTSLPANGGNADTVDNVHLEWAVSQAASSTEWLAGWTADGTKIKAVKRADLSVNSLNRLSGGFSVSGAGWYKLAYIKSTDARGSVRLALVTTGGKYTPRYTELKVSNGWSTIVFNQNGKFDWISKYRYTTDSTYSYIEAYFTGACNITLYTFSGTGYVDDSYSGWQVYSSATAGSGTVAETYDHLTSSSLYTSGHFHTPSNAYAAHFYENSDANLKKNIKEILNSDNMPVIKEFDWKSDGTHSYGLIAQELEEQGYSELVSDSGSHKTVNYSAALSLIVGKLQNKIKELEKEIENLKLRN